MTSPHHFLVQLKMAQLRRQNKKASQVTTKITTSTASNTINTRTTKTIKLTEEQYKNILVAKAITYIRGQA